MARRRNDEIEAFWRDLIEQHTVSDLTVEQCCNRAGVSTASFYAWKRRLRGRPAKGAGGSAPTIGPLVPVRLIGGDQPAAAVSVELPNGIVLRVSGGCDLSMVDAAVHAVRALARSGADSC